MIVFTLTLSRSVREPWTTLTGFPGHKCLENVRSNFRWDKSPCLERSWRRQGGTGPWTSPARALRSSSRTRTSPLSQSSPDCWQFDIAWIPWCRCFQDKFWFANNCNHLLRIHLKLDIELVDEEVDGRGGPGPARVDVQQEETLPLQQGLPLARVLGAFCKLVFLLSCHLAVKEYWHLYKKKYISPSMNV